MLGVCLLFVGIVLINNGMCSLYNVDGKSTAIMNIDMLPSYRTMKYKSPIWGYFHVQKE